MVKTANNFEDLTKTLLKELSGRARDVVERRFGIGTRSKRQTLESIGQTYKITRERVRQIEAAAINKMRQGIIIGTRVQEKIDLLSQFAEIYGQINNLWTP